MVLGRAFAAASTFEEAFGTYENTRKERANGVQLASREQANEIQGVTKRGPNPGATADDASTAGQALDLWRTKAVNLASIDRLLEPSSRTGVGVETALIHRNTSAQGFRREP